ncbi:flagellar assembly protein FliH [Ectopseudomonas guguanensis]|jgi:flagellar assembly protein FliH|uniref:flagellar assembly protein FliH n=1 Tax=Ectopseudomonas guguanensis TaxID=1198456 RepID=UPI0012D6228F|nr:MULTISPECIES: flagellar assembly protein FliH [Pseudomonas]MPT17718.1 flagellar assembly protein H [Pseudomonas sp.]WJH59323.1 flagellar assembly protein H [Pseudomonas guguanensis]
MTVKVIRGDTRQWRAYRFPPRSSQPAVDWSGDAAGLQRVMADGFQQGIEKGYQDGLQQGEEAGRQAGFEQGRAEGLRLGREDGRNEGRREFELAAQPLERISQTLEQYLGELEHKRRQELLELVKKVSQQVIRCELTLHPTQLLALVEEALSSMPGEPEDVQVLLSPEEYARIKALAPERAAGWKLVADERLALGECRVITPQAEADVGCQQRLDACIDTLAEHLHLTEA